MARCSSQRRGAEQAEGDVRDCHGMGSPAGPQLLPVNNRHVPQKELLSSSEEHGYFPPCRLIKESADNFRIGRYRAETPQWHTKQSGKRVSATSFVSRCMYIANML